MIRKGIVALMVLFMAPLSHAMMMIEGSFIGTIYESRDDAGVFGEGVGDDTLKGEKVFGSIFLTLIDGLDMGKGRRSTWGNGSVQSLSLTLSNGLIVDTGNILDYLGTSEITELVDEQVWTDITNDDKYESEQDSIFIDYGIEFGWKDTIPGEGIWTAFDIGIVDYSGNILNSKGPNDWDGFGDVDFTEEDVDDAFGKFNKYGLRSFSYSMDTLIFKTVHVPEPGSASLLVLGLFGLAAIKRRKSL